MSDAIVRQSITALLLLGLAGGMVFSCRGPRNDTREIMKVYDRDPQAFRRKVNTRLPD